MFSATFTFTIFELVLLMSLLLLVLVIAIRISKIGYQSCIIIISLALIKSMTIKIMPLFNYSYTY